MSQNPNARRHAEPTLIGPATPEGELLAWAAERFEPAIRELIRRNNPRLFRVARGIVSSDAEAEDVVQDTYLAAFRRLDGFRGEAAFSTWITRIAINSALSRKRRERPQDAYDTVSESDTTTVLPFPGDQRDMAQNTGEGCYGRRQIRHLLEEAVAGLPPDLRLVFLLSEAEGMKARDIARDLRLNPVTVKTRLFRARKWLKTDLEARVKGGFDAIFPFGGKRCSGMADRVVEALTENSGKRSP